MRKLLILYILFFSSYAFSDCDAPELALEPHAGNLLGFDITKIWSEEDLIGSNRKGSAYLEYGGYGFLITPVSSQKQANPIEVSAKDVKSFLQNKFIRSEYYLDPIDLNYKLYDIRAYDLSGDKKPDLALFLVSAGANVYSGAIGFYHGRWGTLITPMCY